MRELIQAAQEAKAAQVAEAQAEDDLVINQPIILQVAEPDADDNPEMVPRGLQIAAGWSWRLIVIGVVAWALYWGAAELSEIVMPLLAAFLFTAALDPLNKFLVSHRWPGWLASLTCLLTLLAVVFGLLALVVVQIGSEWDELAIQTTAGFEDVLQWLSNGPLHISEDQMASLVDQMLVFMQGRATDIAGIAMEWGGKIGTFFAGTIIALFSLFFFLKDGRRFTALATGYVPNGVRGLLVPALSSGWLTMVNYVRAAVLVAAVDGVGAGMGALILGSNLWVAIMALTFVMAFVPMLGAAIASIVGVLVVFATLGWFKALLMLIVFVVVLEGEVHLLQPLLLGRAVDIHPLAVLLGIAAGMTVAGLAGGVFAIPLVAMAVGVVREIGRQNAKRTTPDVKSTEEDAELDLLVGTENVSPSDEPVQVEASEIDSPTADSLAERFGSL
ncbi:MAG: AI-2E family transporter [Propionibacteriaceae bacterium]|jgi:predicted PurR-regulated permease PerM|nr:AI-2E family transporter [Propionibacteriaceae bacterium]